jgi:hypothetical protein
MKPDRSFWSNNDHDEAEGSVKRNSDSGKATYAIVNPRVIQQIMDDKA